MLDNVNKEHLELLYQEFLKINKAIREYIENADLVSADLSIQNKDDLIKRIIAFEKPYIDDIKADKELLEKRKYLINLEKENIELLNYLKNEAKEKLSKVNKAKKLFSAYEPEIDNIKSTFDIQDDI